jgi:hypothetical protein
MENTVKWLEPVEVVTTGPTHQMEVGSGQQILHTPREAEILALKNEIENNNHQSEWDDAKKITNPYEYVFLSLQKRMHRSLAAIAPLSRSYFKMIELWDVLDLHSLIPADGSPLCTAHTAEGPGGFLEAIQDRTGDNARMIAMTLRSNEKSVPGWRKSQMFLTKYPEVKITYGADNTGNLYVLNNVDTFRRESQQHFGGRKADIYTADGGFDFSADYNSQENTIQRLLAAEALCGLESLREGGVMILKMFDTKNRATIQFLWMLSQCFVKTGLMKPNTSRPANSERYWIGYGMRPDIPAWIPEMLARMTFHETSVGWNTLFDPEYVPWSAAWLSGLQEYQAEMEEQQIHSIQITLNTIKQPTRDLVRAHLTTNIQKSREWCQKHRITLNSSYVGLSDDRIVQMNLEEALAPFRDVGERTYSPGRSPPSPTHRVLSAHPIPPPPAVPAWRSALPLSIRGPKS